jgi:hypothetical protein
MIGSEHCCIDLSLIPDHRTYGVSMKDDKSNSKGIGRTATSTGVVLGAGIGMIIGAAMGSVATGLVLGAALGLIVSPELLRKLDR